MSIFKWQVNSSSNFASFFIIMTHNSSVNFKLILFLFWIKGSQQSPNVETFKCSSENLPWSSCHFPNHKSVFLQISHHPSVSWKITPLYFFRSNIKYFAQYKNQWQCKLLRILSARVKIHQILVIFETTDQFFFKFSINVQGNEIYITTLYFLSKNFYILSTKGVYQKTNLVKVYVSCLWSNGLVVKALDSQSRVPVIKTTGWLQGRVSLSSFQGR